jgi:hypothetical protein
MGEPTESADVTVDLNGEKMSEEITLTLTRAHLTLINNFLAANIQPKGYEMIAFAYDLFTRLNKALEETSVKQEAFGGENNE